VVVGGRGKGEGVIRVVGEWGGGGGRVVQGGMG